MYENLLQIASHFSHPDVWVVTIYISLVTNEVEHLFISLSANLEPTFTHHLYQKRPVVMMPLWRHDQMSSGSCSGQDSSYELQRAGRKL